MPERAYPVDPKELADDEPVPLKLAARLFFRAGGVTEQTLRTEIRNGHLVPERIGGKYFVSRRAINQMRELCRVQPRGSGSISEKEKAAPQNGLSETVVAKRQQDAAKATAKRLKNSSPTTSPKNTKRQPAHAVPIR